MTPAAAVYQLAFNASDLPPLPHWFEVVVQKMDLVHAYYRRWVWIRFLSAVQGPVAVPLFAGWFVQLLSDTTSVGKLLITTLLVVQCLREVHEKLKAMHTAYARLGQSARGGYPLYQKREWEREIISLPVVISKFLHDCRRAQRYLFLLVQRIAVLFVSVFEFVMTLYAVRALAQGEIAGGEYRFQACTQLIVNLQQFYEQCITDNGRILRAVEESAELGDRFLAMIGVQWTLKPLVEHMGNIIEHLPSPSEEFVDKITTVIQRGTIILDRSLPPPDSSGGPYPPWGGNREHYDCVDRDWHDRSPITVFFGRVFVRISLRFGFV